MPKFKGTTVDLGGQPFVLPPMSLGIIEDFQDQIDLFLAGKIERPVTMMIDVLHACLLRNYPDLSRDTVRENVDLESVQALFMPLLKASGWQAGSATEAPEGNPVAMVPGTGDPSTPTS